jgi:hypothetical protein
MDCHRYKMCDYSIKNIKYFILWSIHLFHIMDGIALSNRVLHQHQLVGKLAYPVISRQVDFLRLAFEISRCLNTLCSGERELCTPSGQTLGTYSTLGKKIEGHNSTLNIISPGTHFSSGLKSRSSPSFPCCERKARYSTPVLLVTNKYY